MDHWQGRVAVVTGASNGIGEAVARTLVSYGLIVVGFGRNRAKLEVLFKLVYYTRTVAPLKYTFLQKNVFLYWH